MQFIIDNLAATLVASFVLLVLLASQYRGKEAAIDNTVYYSTKSQTLDLIRMIETDFQNMGAGVQGGQQVITSFSNDAIAFKRKLTEDGPVVTVSYVLEPTTTGVINGESVQLYRISRLVDGAQAGGSLASIRTFQVTLQDALGNQVSSNLLATREVRVELAAAFNMAEGQHITESIWSSTFRPRNLERN